tara:strand:- start:166 stop:1071 length:906 start_codon:yes stop_codon:yes gene_type:complete
MIVAIKNFMKKLFPFLFKRYLSFPTLSFLISTNNKFIKNLYIDFWIFISKRNSSFNSFFFNPLNDKFKIKQTTYNLDNQIDNLNEDCLKSLKHNGILILENALPKDENESIINIFNKISIKHNENFRSNNSLIRYFEQHDLKNFKLLKLISDYFTHQVYGKTLNSDAEFYIHKPLKIPEEIEHGDNNLHIDRFLPNMKILYSPYAISTKEAPFCYAMGSHKINNLYKNFIKISKKFNESEDEAKFFLKNKKEITCKANSIIVALTSGFHGRKSFEIFSDRKLIFLQYHKSYNKISLLFGNR